MNGFVWWVVQNAATTALLVPLVWAVARLRRSRPAEQHLLWLLLLVKLMTPPLVEWPWSVETLREWRLARPDTTDSAGRERASLAATTEVPAPSKIDFADVRVWTEPEPASPEVAGPSDEPIFSPTVIGAIETAASDRPTDLPPEITALPAAEVRNLARSPGPHSAIGPALPESLPTAGSENRFNRLTAGLLAASIWMIGAGIVCFRVALQTVRQRRILGAAYEAPPALCALVEQVAVELKLRAARARVSNDTDTPFVSCLLRPVLVWPASLTDAKSLASCRGVLAHELAHVRRKDHWVARLEAIAAPLWWWNPVFWYLRRRLEETRETACDAVALRSAQADRRAFAELLLAFSASGRPTLSFAPLRTGIAPRHSLRRRLAMVFDEKVSGRVSLAGVALAGLLAAAAAPGWSWAQDVPTNPMAVAEQPADAPAAGPASSEAATPVTEKAAVPASADPLDPPQRGGQQSSAPPGPSAVEPVLASDSPPAAEVPQPATPAVSPLPFESPSIDIGDGKTLRIKPRPDGKGALVQIFENEKLVRELNAEGLTILPGSPTQPSAIPGPRTGILYFTASWSDPDKRMRPTFEKFRNELGNVPLRIVDIDQEPSLAQRYGIESVPTVIAVRHSKVIGRLTGVQPEGALRDLVAMLSENGPAEPMSPQAAPAPGRSARSLSSTSPPAAGTANGSETQVKLLQNALELALLEVQEKQIQLENGKARQAIQQKLYEAGQRGTPPENELPLLEIDLKRAQLQADQAKVRLEAAIKGAFDPFAPTSNRAETPINPVPAPANDAGLGPLEAAVQLAELEVEEKQVLLDNALADEANWQKLYDKKVVSAEDRPREVRLREIELKKARLKLAQAKAALQNGRPQPAGSVRSF